MKVKEKIKTFIPKSLISFYHLTLVFVSALWYRFPAKKMTIVAITGTKGKTTTANLLWQILNKKEKAGLLSSALLSYDGEEIIPNNMHMTMPGRFFIQQSLAKMLKNGCKFAVVEVTSEGIAQHRNKFLFPDLAIFTNLSPEHIESHGSYENYKQAKGSLFAQTASNKGAILINRDDKEAEYFLSFPARVKKTYGTDGRSNYQISDIKPSLTSVSFSVNGVQFSIPFVGKFQATNAAATAASADMLSVFSLQQSAQILKEAESIPGRMQEINEGQDFRVFVDYAHEKLSVKNVLKVARTLARENSVIVVTGATGGMRDKQKRQDIGELIAKYADYSVITNEDPYDEDPQQIIKEVCNFAKEAGANADRLFCITDRKNAIKKAFEIADTGDVVLLLGKGSETFIIQNGKHIPHSDIQTAKELLKEMLSS